MSTGVGRWSASVAARRRITVILAAMLLVPAVLGPRAPRVFATPLAATASSVAPIVALAGYQVSLFAKGTAAYGHPDSVVYDGAHVFVGFQNVTAKDGSDNKTSTVVEYTMGGQVVRTFSGLGHMDGLRLNPVSHLLWALSDEDGNPHLTTIDPASGATKLYHFPTAPPHGGGFDDLAFIHGMALIDASNPNLDKNGVNVFPALDKVTLSGDRVMLTPILMGNASATDIATHKKVSLNLIDPDSMTFDPQGNLVLDNQGGSSLVFISGVGAAQQYVSQLSIGNQVDDSVWATAVQGRLLIADTGLNALYMMRGTFVPGTLYAASPNDSGAASMVSTIDQVSGLLTPVAIGFNSPHGMAFIPDSAQP